MRKIYVSALSGMLLAVALFANSITADAQGISFVTSPARLKIKQFAIFGGDSSGNHLDSLNYGVNLGVVTQTNGNVGSFMHIRGDDAVTVNGGVISGNRLTVNGTNINGTTILENHAHVPYSLI